MPPTERDQAFTAAVTLCFAAGVVSSRAGNIDLATTAARRCYDLARQHDNPGLLGFARWYWALELTSMGARTRADAVLSEGIDDLTSVVRFSVADTLPAEIVGMMHLQQARTAARQQRADEAHAHLDEAPRMANRVGERNGMRQHFGPTNVAAWRISIGVELGEGAKRMRTPLRHRLALKHPEAGSGAPVLEVFADSSARPRIVTLAVRVMPTSGTPAELLAQAGIDRTQIAAAARTLVAARA